MECQERKGVAALPWLRLGPAPWGNAQAGSDAEMMLVSTLGEPGGGKGAGNSNISKRKEVTLVVATQF